MREKVLDDLAGVASGAAGLFADLRDQLRGDMRDRLKDVADRIDLVTRDELLALEARVAALESLLQPRPTAKKAPAKKTVAKKAPAKKAPAKAKKKARR